MTTLSELLPAGGGGNEVEFVASGTLPNGSRVGLKTNGQVEVISESTISQAIPSGSEQVFMTTNILHTRIDFDPNDPNVFIAVFRDNDNSYYGTAIVGSVSGNSISFGSKHTVVSNNISSATPYFDPNGSGTFVIVYTNSSGSNTARVIAGTRSGTSLTFGTAVAISGANGSSPDHDISFNPSTAGQFVIMYADMSTTNKRVRLCTLSGTTITAGSPATWEGNSASQYMQVNFDPLKNDKFVATYRSQQNQYGYAIVGTVSSGSVSFGSQQVFLSSAVTYCSSALDAKTANKLVVVYTKNANSESGTARVGTISGSNISWGSEATYHSGQSSAHRVVFNPTTANECVVIYLPDNNSNKLTAKIGTVSGTSISFSSAFTICADANSNVAGNSDIKFLPNTSEKFVTTAKDGVNDDTSARVSQLASTSTNVSSFVGTSTAAYTNGQTAKIMLQGGVSTNQSSLAIGSTYYVQPNGTLATSAGTPSVIAGKAVKATTLLLKGI
jgi:hypothetical protein